MGESVKRPQDDSPKREDQKKPKVSFPAPPDQIESTDKRNIRSIQPERKGQIDPSRRSSGKQSEETD